MTLMIRNTTYLLIALCLLCLGGTSVLAGEFTTLAAPYPPYAVSRGLRVEGMSVTTLSTIMEQCGMTLNSSDVQLSHWAVGYECTARERRHIMLNAHRNRHTEHLYKWVGPVTTSKIVLIGRKKDKLFIPLKSQIKNYRIATVRWSRAEKASWRAVWT